MTFISRGTRITLSRYLDECDVEYKLRATRKRSDGRLKRHNSCDDLRAWSINFCSNYEYLLDLMSDGEACVNSHVHLFGRYIPVPTLLKALQGVKDSKENLQTYKNKKKIASAGVHENQKQSKSKKDEKTINKKDEKIKDKKDEKNKDKKDEIIKDKKDKNTEDKKDEKIKDVKSEKTEDEKDEKIKDVKSEKTEDEKDENIKDAKNEKIDDKKGEKIKDAKNEKIDDKKGEKINDVKNEKIEDKKLEKTRDVRNEKIENSNDNTTIEKNDEKINDKNDENLWKAECEKYLLEKRFFECKALLCNAIRKLEKIDLMFCTTNEEMNSYKEPKPEVTNSTTRSFSNSDSPSTCNSSLNPGLKKAQDMAKCTALLKKISCLKQKLKNIQERRRDVNEQIRLQKNERCSSGLQVTELFSRKGEAKLKPLQKKLEKLIAGKGKLLSELTKAVSSLNKLKKSISKSKSYLSFKSKKNYNHYDEDYKPAIPVTCNCDCQCTDVESFNSPSSDETSIYGSTEDSKILNNCYTPEGESKYPTKPVKESLNDTSDDRYYEEEFWRNSAETTTTYKNYNFNSDIADSGRQKRGFPGFENKRENLNLKRNTKLKFNSIQHPSCKYAWSSNSEKIAETRLQEQREQEDFESSETIANWRPKTSPALVEISGGIQIPERKIKSETTMEEIEKTLRNYELRLKRLENVENKIKRLKQKFIEGNRIMQEWLKEKSESSKAIHSEREKSKKEMNKLYLENWVLKKRIEQLMEKMNESTQKIEYLRTSNTKLVEYEEELKKKLVDYQESYEGQRKCIAMLEGVIANQRSEIGKLMNFVKNLTSEENYYKNYQDKNVQRSRSYSSEFSRNRKMVRQLSPQGLNPDSPSEDENVWCQNNNNNNNNNMRRVMTSQRLNSMRRCCIPQERG